MNALLTVIALWLSMNFDLPMDHDLPSVEFAPADQIAAMYLGHVPLTRSAGTPDAAAEVRDIVAIYSDASRTIHLPEDWTGATPAESSVLVHEMVHHLQNQAGLRYPCAQEREKLAFAAQERWLGLFGRSLADEFGIDGFTLLARTSCGY